MTDGPNSGDAAIGIGEFYRFAFYLRLRWRRRLSCSFSSLRSYRSDLSYWSCRGYDWCLRSDLARSAVLGPRLMHSNHRFALTNIVAAFFKDGLLLRLGLKLSLRLGLNFSQCLLLLLRLLKNGLCRSFENSIRHCGTRIFIAQAGVQWGQLLSRTAFTQACCRLYCACLN